MISHRTWFRFTRLFSSAGSNSWALLWSLGQCKTHSPMYHTLTSCEMVLSCLSSLVDSAILFKSAECLTYRMPVREICYSPLQWDLLSILQILQHRARDKILRPIFFPTALQTGQVELTRSIADVPLGLDKWMDISGNILSIRLMTSSTYLSGKKNVYELNRSQRNTNLQCIEDFRLFFNLVFY